MRIEAARPGVRQLQPSLIRKLANTAIGQEGIIPLWFGEPDLPTPEFIRQAAKDVLDEGNTFYQPNAGIPILRTTICDYMNALYGTQFGLDNVVVTGSGMLALMLAGQCVVDQGDNIVTHAPTWPNLPSVQHILGASVTRVPLRIRDDQWHLDIDEFLAACNEKTRAILVNSPNNPTGWMMSDADQQAVLDFCRERGLWLIADEVYSRIVFDRPKASSFTDKITDDDRVLIINSFSKTWAMTGWRLGWLTIPSSLLTTVEMLTEFNNSCVPAPTQFAGVEAIRNGESFIQTSLERYRQARDVVADGLASASRVRFITPEATFYAFFAVDGLTSSFDFAQQLLEQAQVGLAPGVAFGPEGEGHLRLCFAAETSVLSTALERIIPFL